MKGLKILTGNAPILMLAALVFSGCTQELTDPEEQDLQLEKSAVVISADTEVRTKTELGKDNTVLWQKGDAIAVLSAEASHPERFTLEEGAGTTSAKFLGDEFNPADGYWAVYPYSADIEPVEALLPIITVPWSGGVQTAVKDGFDPAAALMVGYSTGWSTAFKHVLSYVKFTTDFPCTRVTLLAYNEHIINGDTVTIGIDDKNLPVVLDFTEPETETGGTRPRSTITMIGKDGGIIEPGTYLIAVLPEYLYDGFSISFITAEDNEYKSIRKSSYKEVEFKRAGILNIGTIHAADYVGPDNEWLGDGTASHPYLISNASQLARLGALSSEDNSQGHSYGRKHYFQTNDIDFGGNTLGIGGFHEFSGVYDGGGHTLSNVRPGTYWKYNGFGNHPQKPCNFTGIFTRLKDATIKDLNISLKYTEDGFEYADDEYFTLFGGLTAYATTTNRSCTTTISRCTVTVDNKNVDSDDLQIKDNDLVIYGGLVAAVGSNVSFYDCTTDINVRLKAENTQDSYEHMAGGFIGLVEGEDGLNGDFSVRLDRCRNKGHIAIEGVRDSFAIGGGLIGYVFETYTYPDACLKMTNCVNYGEIEITCCDDDDEAYSGGLVGKHDSDGGDDDPYIYNCLNKGKISAYAEDSWAGGLIGWCYDNDTHVTNCATVGEIVNANNLAGISGGHSGDLSGNGKGDFTYCFKRSDSPSANNLNENRINLPSISGVVYADWMGSGDGIYLDLD